MKINKYLILLQIVFLSSLSLKASRLDSINIVIYEKYNEEFNLDNSFRTGFWLNFEGDWHAKKDTIIVHYEEKLMRQELMDDITSLYPGKYVESDFPKLVMVDTIIIIDYGDQLKFLNDKGSAFYKSKQKFDFNYYYTAANTPLSSYYDLPEYMETDWHKERFEWQWGEYRVMDKTEIEGEVMKVLLTKDGVKFTVINPKYYLRDWDLELYDKDYEDQYTDWMHEVEIGKKYCFDVVRPSYPYESIRDFPKLQVIPKYMYIMDDEAYGYFFARLCRNYSAKARQAMGK